MESTFLTQKPTNLQKKKEGIGLYGAKHLDSMLDVFAFESKDISSERYEYYEKILGN